MNADPLLFSPLLSVPNVTWEGDSYMLTQQCTRYLFKQMRALKKNREKADKNITTDYMIRYLENKDDHATINHSGDVSRKNTEPLLLFSHFFVFLLLADLA
jgi:hypothetical protein